MVKSVQVTTCTDYLVQPATCTSSMYELQTYKISACFKTYTPSMRQTGCWYIKVKCNNIDLLIPDKSYKDYRKLNEYLQQFSLKTTTIYIYMIHVPNIFVKNKNINKFTINKLGLNEL